MPLEPLSDEFLRDVILDVDGPIFANFERQDFVLFCKRAGLSTFGKTVTLRERLLNYARDRLAALAPDEIRQAIRASMDQDNPVCLDVQQGQVEDMEVLSDSHESIIQQSVSPRGKIRSVSAASRAPRHSVSDIDALSPGSLHKIASRVFSAEPTLKSDSIFVFGHPDPLYNGKQGSGASVERTMQQLGVENIATAFVQAKEKRKADDATLNEAVHTMLKRPQTLGHPRDDDLAAVIAKPKLSRSVSFKSTWDNIVNLKTSVNSRPGVDRFKEQHDKEFARMTSINQAKANNKRKRANMESGGLATESNSLLGRSLKRLRVTSSTDHKAFDASPGVPLRENTTDATTPALKPTTSYSANRARVLRRTSLSTQKTPRRAAKRKLKTSTAPVMESVKTLTQPRPLLRTYFFQQHFEIPSLERYQGLPTTRVPSRAQDVPSLAMDHRASIRNKSARVPGFAAPTLSSQAKSLNALDDKPLPPTPLNIKRNRPFADRSVNV